MLSLCPLWKHQYLPEGSYTYLVPPVFMSVTPVLGYNPETVLNCLALEVREACIPKPHGFVTIKRQFLSDTTLRVLHRQQTETHPQFLKKGLFACPWRFSLMQKASVLADIQSSTKDLSGTSRLICSPNSCDGCQETHPVAEIPEFK